MANRVTLRCTKDGTNYEYTGTDTQPSSGKYLKYTNGSKTGYLYLNRYFGYVATLSNDKKLRVNDKDNVYYVEQFSLFEIYAPEYSFSSSRYTTWASKDSSYSDGYIRQVKPRLIVPNLGQSSYVINLYYPYSNWIGINVTFERPDNSPTTKSFKIKCNEDIKRNIITDDDYYAPTYYQAYRSSNEYFSCYFTTTTVLYPVIFHGGSYYDYSTCDKIGTNWYRTAEG